MFKDRRSIRILVSGLAVTLLWVASPAVGSEGLSPATRHLLKQEKLRKLARNNPAEAIRTLDLLRPEVDPETLDLAIAEVALVATRKDDSTDREGLYLCAAAATWRTALTQASVGGGRALDLYAEAVGGLVSTLQEGPSEAIGGGRAEISGPLTRYTLSWLDAGPEWTPITHELRPVSRQRRKKILGAREGLGAPLVAISRADTREEEPKPEHGVFEIYRHFYPLTAVLEFGQGTRVQPRSATVRLLDPRLNESYEIGGQEVPLAIDLGAQFEAFQQEVEVISGRRGVLRAGKLMALTSLQVSEPLRPGKIPLVLVHGLASTPATWTAAGSRLMLDQEIRRNYQLWLFTYPTGIDHPFSASLLRASLVEAQRRLEAVGRHAANDRMVMIGHSMGGLLTRMQVTDTGMALWNQVFTKPPAELDLPAEDVERLSNAFIVEPLPFIERVVFCSTPHRGSKVAAKFAGKVGAAFVKLPKEMLDLSRRMAFHLKGALTEEIAQQKKIPDSVQSLRPTSPILRTLDTLPIAPQVTFHSLIGDRGKGNTLNSSDGVVPYWSSHLNGAASELIVPSDHSSHRHPQGIEELRRILLLHLES